MLKQALVHAKSVAIGGHVRPDGDCVGSCMGLYQYLKTEYPQIDVDVYLEPIPECFTFIDATKDIKNEAPKEKVYDLYISLDCGDSNRLTFSEHLFHAAKHTFCVDHHISNQGFAENNYIVPEASSASELVYRLLDADKITKEVAECLYMGIVHDTGVFQYSSTSPETMEIAANLMRKGIDASSIIEKTYYEKTFAQNQILGRCLLDSKLGMGGACIVEILSADTMAEYGVTSKDLEGVVSHMRQTKGVEVAIFLYELGKNEYKVSMRSNGDVDVSIISQLFGGGGHKKAAGVTMNGNAKEIVDKLTAEIAKQL